MVDGAGTEEPPAAAVEDGGGGGGGRGAAPPLPSAVPPPKGCDGDDAVPVPVPVPVPSDPAAKEEAVSVDSGTAEPPALATSPLPSSSSSFASSQPPSQTQTQTQTTEVLTQSADWTQLGDDDDDDDDDEGDGSQDGDSDRPPRSPVPVPWGRLVPCGSPPDAGANPHPPPHGLPLLRPVDLLPRPPPPADGGAGIPPRPGDPFNEHTLGRSDKCDVRVERPLPPAAAAADAGAHKLREWAHGMVSNRHARIYCAVQSPSGIVDVYVEDTSHNGTLVNGTHLLRRHERRLLHSGDEVCLLNPQTLAKKVRSRTALRRILQQHSYVFVRLAPHLHPNLRRPRQRSPVPVPPFSHRKPAVDPRAVRHPSSSASQHQHQILRISPRRTPVRRIELDYDLRDVLGSGTVGEVRRAIDRRTGVPRAVKVVPLPRHPSNQSHQQAAASAALEAEASVLRTLDHPYVVQLLDVYTSPDAVYLVMELLQGGDLFDRILLKGRYNETDARRVMRRLLAALHYLHDNRRVVHRDLKPENILLVSRDNDVDIKLTDFGLAKSMASAGSVPPSSFSSIATTARGALKTFCGTPLYFAPEILQRRTSVHGRGRYDHKADLWSVGVTLYVLLSGTQPFADEDWTCAGTTGLAPLDFAQPHWDGVSHQATDLVRKLLQPDPRRRLSAAEACEHPWILQDDGDTHRHPLDDPRLAGVVVGVERRGIGGEGEGGQEENQPGEPPGGVAPAAVPAAEPTPTARSHPDAAGGIGGPFEPPDSTPRPAALSPAVLPESRPGPLVPGQTPCLPRAVPGVDAPEDDDILSRFSEKTESISSFGTAAEEPPAQPSSLEAGPAPTAVHGASPGAEQENHAPSADARNRKRRRVTDSAGHPGGTITTPTSKRKPRKSGPAASNSSQAKTVRSSRKAASDEAGGTIRKQTTLSTWFKQI